MSNPFSATVVVVANDGFGQGDEALRRKVIATYFRTLAESGFLPRAVVFYTAGVKMVADDSPCLEELRLLAEAGVPLIICRTCLEYYALTERVAIGEISNMLAIVELQGAAAKVITL